MNRLQLALTAAMLLALSISADRPALGADRFDAAMSHAGRPEADLKRDGLDHPADILRLSGIKPGMKVADVLAGDGYYSELVSYIVGPQGHVALINNAAFDTWSEPALDKRLAGARLSNVTHQTVDLNDMKLEPGSLDVVLLIKVYHDLYWIDSRPNSPWPKIDVGAVLTQLSKALKPGGVLLLVDHSAKSGHGATDASKLHRIEESFAIDDFKAHGLRLLTKSEQLRRPDDARDQITFQGPMVGKTDRFVLVFRKT